MTENVVLDTSALLTIIQEEKGADIIRPLLKSSVMSVVNVAEALTVLQRVKSILPEEAVLSISNIIKAIIPFELDQAQYVAELYPQVRHKGLSLGDRACIALGIQRQAPIYTADKAWGDLRLENAEIKVIR